MSTQKSSDNCAGCDARVKRNDEGLKCDGCDRWFHIACERVGKVMYKALKDHEDLIWFCGGCREESKKIKDIRKEVEGLVDEKMKKMEERLIGMKEEISEEILGKVKAEWMVEITRLRTDLVDEVNSIKHKLDQIGMSINNRPETTEEEIVTAEEVKSTVLQEMEEAEERKRRACNVVLYNIPESKSEVTDERIEADANWCMEMCTETLEVEVGKEDIDSIIRLGKKPETEQGKPRPILLKLKKEKTKWEILTNAKKLRNANSQVMKKVGIAKDMTKKEMEENSKLRKDLKERQDRGEKGWKIKNGKLIKAEIERRRG